MSEQILQTARIDTVAAKLLLDDGIVTLRVERVGIKESQIFNTMEEGYAAWTALMEEINPTEDYIKVVVASAAAKRARRSASSAPVVDVTPSGDEDEDEGEDISAITYPEPVHGLYQDIRKGYQIAQLNNVPSFGERYKSGPLFEMYHKDLEKFASGSDWIDAAIRVACKRQAAIGVEVEKHTPKPATYGMF